MPRIYKIGTLNINGRTSNACITMLENFLKGHDFDILQEVRTTKLEALSNYKTYINVGEERCVTAILIREGLRPENLKRLPSGRGMSMHVQGICIVTVYAPSGAGKREREDFFVSEVPTLLPTVPMEMILAGDFNLY
jgi:exonuclease III